MGQRGRIAISANGTEIVRASITLPKNVSVWVRRMVKSHGGVSAWVRNAVEKEFESRNKDKDIAD